MSKLKKIKNSTPSASGGPKRGLSASGRPKRAGRPAGGRRATRRPASGRRGPVGLQEAEEPPVGLRVAEEHPSASRRPKSPWIRQPPPLSPLTTPFTLPRPPGSPAPPPTPIALWCLHPRADLFACPPIFVSNPRKQ